MHFRVIIIAACLLSFPCAAQDFVHEPQGWLAFFGQKKLGDGPFVVWLDTQARLNSAVTQTQLLLRPGVGLRFRPDMTAWFGYAWTPTIKAGVITVDEHRFWQQWTWDLTFETKVKLSLRSRLEERLVKSEVGLRFRQFVRLQSPRFGPSILALWDEVFVAFNDTSWGQQAGFDQNRAFAGVGVFVAESVRLEAGYLNQWVLRRAAPDPVRHVALVSVFANW